MYRPRPGVLVDPSVSSGRPTVEGTAINTVVVADHIMAGMTVSKVAEGYAVDPELVRAAVAFERQANV